MSKTPWCKGEKRDNKEWDLELRFQDIRVGLHYGGEGLRLVKNAWPRHGYVRQMVDVLEKN